MYTLVWNKYLPVVRILLKRAAAGAQTFKQNTSDFDKSGPTKKTSYKSSIQFLYGRAENITGMQALAKDLSAILLQDPVIKQLFSENEYTVSMDSKFQLTVAMVKKPDQEPELSVAASEAEV